MILSSSVYQLFCLHRLKTKLLSTPCYRLHAGTFDGQIKERFFPPDCFIRILFKDLKMYNYTLIQLKNKD